MFDVVGNGPNVYVTLDDVEHKRMWDQFLFSIVLEETSVARCRHEWL